ncbi:MAG: LmeA family phospholipid-binding protein [Cyanobacteriota bacterium]
MEILAILLGLLAGLGGGVGYFANQSARQLLLEQFDQAEVLEVRIQSQPNYRLLKGQADRLLIAGRGLYRAPFPRLDVLELETDALAINPSSFQGAPLQLDRPLQAAVRIVVRENDLNAALNLPEILSQFQNIEADLPFGGRRDEPSRFDLRQPHIDLLDPNRIQLSAILVERNGEMEQSIDVMFNAAIRIQGGQNLQLEDPEFVVASVRVPDEISEAFLAGLNEVFNLKELEELGIFLRLLSLEVRSDQLQVIGFVRVETLAHLTGFR